MVGKGLRSKEVLEAMRKHRCVYFGAVEGTAALLARISARIAREMRKTDLEADIWVVKDGKEYKLGPASKPLILKLLALSAEEGDELEVFAEGPDAEEALEVFENTAHACALYRAEKLRSDRNGGVVRPSSHEDGL